MFDIFFGYNPFVMITIYMVIANGIAHAVRANIAPSKAAPQAHSVKPYHMRQTDAMDQFLGPYSDNHRK